MFVYLYNERERKREKERERERKREKERERERKRDTRMESYFENRSVRENDRSKICLDNRPRNHLVFEATTASFLAPSVTNQQSS